MSGIILFAPSDELIDSSLGARQYLQRLRKLTALERRPFPEPEDDLPERGDARSVAVLAGLSSLELSSGYMEMEIDTIFEPQELLKRLRAALPGDYPVIAVVDDAYSDYILRSYVKAGASAVVGTSGVLFGLVTSRLCSWDDVTPYINVIRRV